MRLNGNSLFAKFYKNYVDDYFFPDNIEDHIYFKEKADKNTKKIFKKSLLDQGGFLVKIASYPRICINKFAKLSHGRKIFVFVMMSFISYLVLVISHLLKEKEKHEL